MAAAPAPARWGVRRRLPPRHDDRGAVAVELALGAPILLGVLLLLTQMFAWGVGYLAAHAAADHALQATRVVGGTAAGGEEDARTLLGQLGGSFVDNPDVTADRGPVTTTVTIRGSAHGLPLPIAVTVHAPTERYTR